MGMVHLVGLSGLLDFGMNGFCFALIAGQATSFVLKQKEAKIQDDNDPSALRASTRLGVLVGLTLLPGLFGFRGN